MTFSRKKPGQRELQAASEWVTLSRREVAERAAHAPTDVERRRWQVILLLTDQTSQAEIVTATGYRPRTIRQIVQQYRTLGEAGLSDRRQRHPAPALLSAAQQQALRKALQQPPPDGAAWTGPKVAQWMSTVLGKPVHRQRGWEYLQRFGSESVDAGQLPCAHA
jgi:transposase